MLDIGPVKQILDSRLTTADMHVHDMPFHVCAIILTVGMICGCMHTARLCLAHAAVCPCHLPPHVRCLQLQ